jgi:hypothetical protein
MTHALVLRAAALSAVVLSLAAAPADAHAQATGRPPAPPARRTSEPLPAEEARYAARADALRARILAATRWTDLEGDSCTVGVLRTFAADSAGDTRMRADVAELERVIIARGIDDPIDTPRGHDLLRTLAAWEAHSTRPRWDVPAGETPRQAIAAGLGGSFRNPSTRRCESVLPADTATIVLPPLTNFTPPATPGVRLTLYAGEDGVRRARDVFHGAIGARDTAAVLTYTKVRAAVIWRDYAVVAVNRPAERGGVQLLDRGLGGATYIFHRVGDEWRLLSIVRTWA